MGSRLLEDVTILPSSLRSGFLKKHKPSLWPREADRPPHMYLYKNNKKENSASCPSDTSYITT